MSYPRYRLSAPSELSQGTQIIDEANGQVLNGIYSIDLHVRVDEPIRATIGILGVMGEAKIGDAKFFVRDPFDGEMRPIKRVEYEDGSCLEVQGGRLIRTDANR